MTDLAKKELNCYLRNDFRQIINEMTKFSELVLAIKSKTMFKEPGAKAYSWREIEDIVESIGEI